MENLDKIYQIVIVFNDNNEILVKKEGMNTLPGSALEIGEVPLDSVMNFLRRDFEIEVSDLKAVGVSLDKKDIVTLIYQGVCGSSFNENATWIPRDSVGEILEPFSKKVISEIY